MIFLQQTRSLQTISAVGGSFDVLGVGVVVVRRRYLDFILYRRRRRSLAFLVAF